MGGSAKVAMAQRVEKNKEYQNAVLTLRKKEETEQKFRQQGKAEKMPLAEAEVREASGKVDSTQKAVQDIGVILKRELDNFDRLKVQDLQECVIEYIEAL